MAAAAIIALDADDLAKPHRHFAPGPTSIYADDLVAGNTPMTSLLRRARILLRIAARRYSPLPTRD